jgi:translation initiation factor IF-2
MRGDREVFTGEIASLRRFENDAREVQADRECGIRVKDFDQVEVGDRLVFFTMEEVTH